MYKRQILGIGTDSVSGVLHTAKPGGTFGSMATFNSQKGDVKLRIDDVSNSATTQRIHITHNQSRGGGGFAADDSGYGLASIAFDDGTITLGTNSSGNTTTSVALKAESTGRIKIGGDDTNYSTSTGSKLSVECMTTAGTILEICDQTSHYVTFESIRNAGGGAADYGGYIFRSRRDADDDVAEWLRIEGDDGDVLPGNDNSQDLGSTSKRWANIYSADLQLSNEGMGNDVDGTWGQYTIQEGENDLFLLNRRNGKKYKFVLQEVN